MKVIALLSFNDNSDTFHPYGHEFEMPEGEELTALLNAGILRRDDRREKFADLPQGKTIEDMLPKSRRASKAAKVADDGEGDE